MDTFRALHLIFIVTWFSGLFYIVRLMIYHLESESKEEGIKSALQSQLTIMERRLWYGITWPSAVLTLIFGMAQIHQFIPIKEHFWLSLKLILVALLYTYHILCGNFLRSIWKGTFTKSATFLRYWNELATLFLVSIVFLAVLKNSMDMLKALFAFIGFAILLALAIKIYKKLRTL